MNHAVKAYVCWVAAVGSVAICAAISEWQFTHPARFPIYFSLAFLMSMVKLRVPEITGTFSCSSLISILAVAGLDRAEAMLIAIGAAAGQTLVNVRERPKVVQLVFNIAALGVSMSAATAAKAIASGDGSRPVLSVCCAAGAFYLVNTLVVSAVLALVHAKTVGHLWRAWLRWTTPAFVVSGGSGVALFALNPEFQWQPALLMIPAAVLFQLWYRRAIERQMVQQRVT